jgi:hypothetical protein
MHTGRIGLGQYHKLCDTFRVLVYARISVRTPVLPYRQEGKILWPVGEFDGWYWDCEIDAALRYGAEITIIETYVYVKAPVLKDWATWILGIIQAREPVVPPIVGTWLKHCSRSLIGRLALTTRSWELFGANPDRMTGITHMTDLETGATRRLMHIGGKTFIESDREESDNSVPMITGAIVAECRVRLWEAMNAAGLGHLAHVDTDSLLVDQEGLARLTATLGYNWQARWAIKGSWATIDVRAPRHYYRGRQRVIAGIPKRALEGAPGVFQGERWASLATDLEARGDGVVTTWRDEWTPKNTDPRRTDSPAGNGETEAYSVGLTGSSSMSDTPRPACGS